MKFTPKTEKKNSEFDKLSITTSCWKTPTSRANIAEKLPKITKSRKA
jgi:hypothetical protein